MRSVRAHYAWVVAAVTFRVMLMSCQGWRIMGVNAAPVAMTASDATIARRTRVSTGSLRQVGTDFAAGGAGHPRVATSDYLSAFMSAGALCLGASVMVALAGVRPRNEALV